jgi:hypothetical protein
MPLADKFSIVLLGLILGAQVCRRSFFLKYAEFAWRLSVAGVFCASLYWAWAQYRLWQASALSRFFLPPYQSWGYFFSYVGQRIFAPWLISFLAAIFISRLAGFFNRKYGERFFESEEISLMALGIFLTGYPGFFVYLILIFLGGILLSIFSRPISESRHDGMRLDWRGSRLSTMEKTSSVSSEIKRDCANSIHSPCGSWRVAGYFLLSRGRAPLYYFWLPMAISAILIKSWLIPQPWLDVFIL